MQALDKTNDLKGFWMLLKIILHQWELVFSQ